MIQIGKITLIPESRLLLRPIAWLKAHPLLVGSVLFFASTTLINLGNYIFNLVLGRQLGPSLFADLSLIVTLMLITTFATTAFSTATAKFTAEYVVQHDASYLAALRSWLSKKALLVGLVFSLVLILGASWLAQIFQMHSFWPFVILGLGLPLSFWLSIDRGILQGQTRFVLLSLCNQGEMWTRLLGAIAFVVLGWAVNGVTGALVLSFAVAWIIARGAGKNLPKNVAVLSKDERSAITRYFGPVVLGLIGQIIINNSDVLIVKSYFPAHEAGLYAALALIGRMVFFATWSVVMVMFPLVAQKFQKGEAHRFLLWISFAIITIVSLAIIGGTLLLPNLIVNLLFGSAYLSIAPLLWLYALATAFYALANVVVTYNLSLGNGNGSFLVLLAGIAQIVGLLIWHANLLTVVMVQVSIMAGLFAILLGWDQLIKRDFTPKKDKKSKSHSLPEKECYYEL